MKTTTFRQRLKLAKANLRKKQTAGEVVELTRQWSNQSLKELQIALSGGIPAGTKLARVRKKPVICVVAAGQGK